VISAPPSHSADAPSDAPPLQPLRWDASPDGPALILLDQTALPAQEVEVACTSVQTLVEAIRRQSVSGPLLLGLAGAYGVALAAARGLEVRDAAEQLMRASPSTPMLTAGVTRARDAYLDALRAHPGSEQGAAAAALAAARALHQRQEAMASALAGHGLALLDELVPGGGLRLLTHCDTGPLSSGGEGTAFAVALAAHRQTRLRCLWLAETRPTLSGSRLAGYEAARAGVSYTLLADAAMGSLLASGDVDAVLVGAELIGWDGSVLAPVGSYPLAVLAERHGVPFVVVAPEEALVEALPEELEQSPSREVTEISGVQLAPPGSAAYNPAAEVVPTALITAFVLDSGVQRPSGTAEWRISLPSVSQVTDGQ
jgi:methylthioribose-1-phosphate isomerase